jgi:hypothetical protein
MEMCAMSDENQWRIETIADHLRGLGLTDQQIERHVAPLKQAKPKPRQVRGRTSWMVSRLSMGCRKAAAVMIE